MNQHTTSLILSLLMILASAFVAQAFAESLADKPLQIAQLDQLKGMVGQAQCASVKSLGPQLNNAASLYYSKHNRNPASFTDFVSPQALAPNDPRTLSLSQSGFTSCRVSGKTLTCNTPYSGVFTYTYGGIGNIQITQGQCR